MFEDVHAILLNLLIGEARNEHGLLVKLVDVALQNSFLLGERLRGRELIELGINVYHSRRTGETQGAMARLHLSLPF